MPTVIAIGNRKGGVGKTSVTLMIAEGLALKGRPVLVIDLDQQRNLTTTLKVDGPYTIFDVLYAGEAGTLGQAIVPTAWSGISAIPGDEGLVRIDTEPLMAAEMRLKSAAWGVEELEAFDYVLLDLPPNLGRLTLNGLIWADYVLAVTETTAFSVSGLGEFLETVDKVRRQPHLNPDLKLLGILPNKFRSQLGEHQFQLEQMREAYGTDVLEPVLPNRTAVLDMQSSKAPLHKLGTRGAAAIIDKVSELVATIERRIGHDRSA
ncbi:ParA family protein [Acaricomes phytoseiuli]|uniref:ParA family protein n=1 Tax=Acaricomes phytoseiuli TaxID=291968 RepID=UPI0006874BBF|nr:ParA family protein [Acaricomes phytoseiuli]